ncbi:TonB-dependent siderophore receptor [Methylorubrum populi BJ001]|uniref:TonB-dependent siderophore receptor n=1 Tax=Methylorubrum populi (strain ATCC BAA-705 / NCIMB 13946 / BJ001) TaxID=441620 RepID=B1ZBX0_METPB|nr:TonB-dependent siderophore receptor [Methylorubrum populi]ACB79313.1 TonB-dependent siderophore receptor [Methylorubrum populi BJ001]PZP69674.1 MAG: TonB-dependent siderophore receptor [Methylorubrum populi]
MRVRTSQNANDAMKPARHPRWMLAALLCAGLPGPEARAQESVTLEELAVEGEGRGQGVGNGAPDSRTAAAGTIGLIGPTPGYRAERAVSATRTDTPQRDVPQIVTVAPREVITDLAATRVDRVFNYTPGVAQQNNFGGLSVFSYAIRGVTTSEIYKNGFPLNRGTPPPPDTQNVERIEVLKGPGGGLFGRSDPGGLVNIITKQPTAERFVEMGGLWGSFGQFRGTVDSGGALNEEGTLLYRFNLAAGRQGSFRDFVDGDRLLVAPVLSWQITPDTRITVETEFLRNRIVFDRGVIALNGRLGILPISRFLGEPGQSTYQTNNTMQVRVDHRFNADWQMRLATHFNTGTLEGESAEIRAIAADNRTVSRDRNIRDYRWDVAIGQAEVVGRFDTAGIGHTMLLGFERESTDSRVVYNRSNFRTSPYAIDIYDPRYGQPLPPITIPRNNLERITNTALYAQDQISLSPEWKALVGVRFDFFEQSFRERIPRSQVDQTYFAATPRAGLVYQPTPELALFTNVGTSFRPNIGPDAAAVARDGPFAPETGIGYEVGAKLDLYGGALALTGTAFLVDRENVLTPDPNNSAFSLAAGGVRSQGIELTAAGQITPEIKLLAGYVFAEATITKDNVLPVGTPLINVPRHSGSLLAVHEVQAGPWKGLGLGGGVRGVGERPADAVNSFSLPAYIAVDALAYYRYENFRFGLNVENVFDTEYYESSLNRFRVYPGSPRRFTGTLTVRF